MTKKTKGWVSLQVNEHLYEVLPVHDSRDHWKLDECWCHPETQDLGHQVECRDGVARTALMITHNAADKREYSEPDHVGQS